MQEQCIEAILKYDRNDRPTVNRIIGQLNITVKRTKSRGFKDYITILTDNETELNILLMTLNKESFWGVVIHKTKIKEK